MPTRKRFPRPLAGRTTVPHSGSRTRRTPPSRRIFRARKTLFPTLLSLLLLLALLPALSACDDGTAELIAFAREPLRVVLAYDEGGVSVRAELTLGAAPKAGETRDAALTYLSPDTVAGITYTRADGKTTVSQGDHVFNATDAPLRVADLFTIPSAARVTGIERAADGSRRATIADGATVYTLLFRPGEDRPAALSRRVGDTDYLTATVEEYRPTD